MSDSLERDKTVYPVDYLGKEIKKGSTVVRACMLGRSPVLELRTVVRVEGTTVWTQLPPDGRASKVQFNDRMIVLNYN